MNVVTPFCLRRSSNCTRSVQFSGSRPDGQGSPTGVDSSTRAGANTTRCSLSSFFLDCTIIVILLFSCMASVVLILACLVCDLIHLLFCGSRQQLEALLPEILVQTLPSVLTTQLTRVVTHALVPTLAFALSHTPAQVGGTVS